MFYNDGACFDEIWELGVFKERTEIERKDSKLIPILAVQKTDSFDLENNQINQQTEKIKKNNSISFSTTKKIEQNIPIESESYLEAEINQENLPNTFFKDASFMNEMGLETLSLIDQIEMLNSLNSSLLSKNSKKQINNKNFISPLIKLY